MILKKGIKLQFFEWGNIFLDFESHLMKRNKYICSKDLNSFYLNLKLILNKTKKQKKEIIIIIWNTKLPLVFIS